MTGDLPDIVSRLLCVLPKRWFADNGPNLNAILTSMATPWVWLYNLLNYAGLQTRISTATDFWLDLAAVDFFTSGLTRKIGESDTSYRARIKAALLQGAASRAEISTCMENLIGSAPAIFEPANCSDTGSYGIPDNNAATTGTGLAYGVSGGWGSLNLPFQFFVTVKRPPTPGVGMLAGYGTGAAGFDEGSLAYIDLSQLPGQVTDEDIQKTLRRALPVNTVAWLRII